MQCMADFDEDTICSRLETLEADPGYEDWANTLDEFKSGGTRNPWLNWFYGFFTIGTRDNLKQPEDYGVTKLNIDRITFPSRLPALKKRGSSRHSTVKVNLLAYDRQLTTGKSGSGRHIAQLQARMTVTPMMRVDSVTENYLNPSKDVYGNPMEMSKNMANADIGVPGSVSFRDSLQMVETSSLLEQFARTNFEKRGGVVDKII
jgi:hypothetical protein